MKRLICLLLALLLLSGCFADGKRMQDPVTFYYLRSEISYGEAEGVITSEAVEAAGHVGDLNYLLALYLAGPLSDQLRSPFPKDVKLTSVTSGDATLIVELEGSFEAMEPLAVTKACVCLAMTGLGMTNAESASIRLLDPRENTTKTVDIPRDSVILEDIIPETT